MAERRVGSRPLVAGALAGIVAWGVGYAVTFVLTAPAVRESPVHRFIEALDGEPATYEMVGWVFYNAHFVNTVFRDVPLIGSHTTSFIGGEDGFTLLLYAIPVVALSVAGLALARYRRATDPTTGLRAGVAVLPGYLVVAVIGAFLFEVSLGGSSGGPDLLPSIFLCGTVYPVLFGGGGGALGGFLDRRARPSKPKENTPQ